MNSTEIAYIYGLVDPRNNKIRYIGKTINPKSRMYSHFNEIKYYNTYKSRWIKKILSLKLKPIMKILKICPLEDFEKYEAEYIKIYKLNNLVNSDEAGQGNIGRRKEIIEKSIEKISKIVYQYDINGNYIKKYKSVREASRNLNIDHSHIVRCCNGTNKHTKGFIFKYEYNKNVKPVENPNALKKKVAELDAYGNIIKTWNSLMDCCRDTGIDNGNLSRVCSNKQKSIKKRHFTYI